jgi:uncharacterized repeat protein (TIGR03803 family)
MKTMKRLLIVLALLMPCSVLAQTESIIYNFQFDPSPYYSLGDLIFDNAGNLYGTAYYGGIANFGAVFQLVPGSGGSWSLNTLHSFIDYPSDGAYPAAALTIDEKGNLYGTTFAGGEGNAGIVFELSPQPDEQWSYSIPYYFQGDNGSVPYGGLILYKGTLYGTTSLGGSNQRGTVYSLSPSASGDWTESAIYNLTSSDGFDPYASLSFDGTGNFYGTTDQNGENGGGVVFEVSPGTGGNWNGRVLHAFSEGLDGGTLYGSLAIDKSGNLYGTTYYGGKFGFGTVFELIRGPNGRWTGNTIHNFTGSSDGGNPYAGPTLDSAGNVYGTAVNGGFGFGYGTVYELIPNNGAWTEKTIYQFGTNDNDGVNPYGRLAFDTAGNLYGTTYRGGTEDVGTVFKIVP